MAVASQRGGDSLVRIWTGELPDAAYAPVRVLERVVSATAAPSGGVAETRVAAVERFQHTGPGCRYALIGGAFTPGAGPLVVQVGVSAGGGRRFPGALVWGGEVVRVGLPQEYASFALDAVADDDGTAALGPGILRFDRAAHGELSSSPMWFAIVARRVVRLLASGTGARAAVARLVAAAPDGVARLGDM